MRALLVALAACTRSAAPEPPHNVAPSPSKLVPIEEVAPLDLPIWHGAARDCRPSQVIRHRFAGKTVIACGPLDVDSPAPAIETARRCLATALADGQPFLHELSNQAIDTTSARGLVGVIERGELVTYQFLYDANPCGTGDCPERGSTEIERCDRLVRDPSRPDACAIDLTRCYRCEGARQVEVCRFGARGT